MPKDKNFKRLVRERMAKTGESYVTARAHLLASPAHERTAAEDLGPMFTWDVAPAIKLAQDEARLRNAVAIRPSHLLLGLLDRGGAAVATLMAMNVSTAAVRAAVERSEPPRAPTSSPRAFGRGSKEVLALAVVESRELGEPSVSNLALLLALASAAGPARDALAEYGASEDRLRVFLEDDHGDAIDQDRVRARVLELLADGGESSDDDDDDLVREVVVSDQGGRLRIEIHTPRPGRVIGRRGQTADWLRQRLEAEFGDLYLDVFETKPSG